MRRREAEQKLQRAIPARNRGRKRGEGSGEIAHVETKLRRQSSASIEWRNGETAAAPSSAGAPMAAAAARVCARGRRLRLLGLDGVPGGSRALFIGAAGPPWRAGQGRVRRGVSRPNSASARVLPGHGRKKTLTGGAHAVVREEGEGAERAGRRVWAGVLAGMETGCSLGCGGRKGKKKRGGGLGRLG